MIYVIDRKHSKKRNRNIYNDGKEEASGNVAQELQANGVVYRHAQLYDY
jgi:hypothetical protein